MTAMERFDDDRSCIDQKNHCAKKSLLVFCAVTRVAFSLRPTTNRKRATHFSSQLEILAAESPRTTN